MKSNTIEKKIEEITIDLMRSYKVYGDARANGQLVFPPDESEIKQALQQIADEARKEGSVYVGKTKREWYQRGFEEGKKEERKKIRTKLEKLLDLKRAKELVNNFMLFANKTYCSLCGTDPLRQREMILDSVNSEFIKEDK